MASYSDNFNRSDSGSLGANWTDDVNGWEIASNRAVGLNVEYDFTRYTGSDLDSIDHEVEAEIHVDGGSNKHGGIGARQNATLTFYLLGYMDESVGAGYELHRIISGGSTLIDSAASGSGNKRLRLVVDGSSQEGYVEDVLEVFDDDTLITSGVQSSVVCSEGNGRIDNFSAWDLLASVIVTPSAISAVVGRINPTVIHGSIIITPTAAGGLAVTI
ncbi:unnamed protein product, partial [marine sediment metagenome]